MRSMTGFGTAEGVVGKGQLFVEVKTVNHRFCEVYVKEPPKMGGIGLLIKKHLESKYSRGKVDVYVKEVVPLLGGVEVSVDMELALKYQRALKKLSHELGLKVSDNLLDYISLDHFVTAKEKAPNYDRFWGEAKKLLDKACSRVDKMRDREGRYILKDQRQRIDKVAKTVAQIRKDALKTTRRNENKLRERVNKLGQLDEQRLATEVAYLGGRQDIAEEITRLESHILQYKASLSERKAVGRKLDFLLQEINREVNTIGSKANDIQISRLVVDCKAELERIREQVQNVE